ncbi:MAG: phage tail protein, partial [Oscillospiraceae bacterium]|nr:phage tail protein [Oscillospiraceae bacterium]
MCSDFADRAGIPVRDGSDMAVRLYTAAVQIESLYLYNDWVKDQCFPQTAGGEYLDYHAEMRGLRRQAAT